MYLLTARLRIPTGERVKVYVFFCLSSYTILSLHRKWDTEKSGEGLACYFPYAPP